MAAKSSAPDPSARVQSPVGGTAAPATGAADNNLPAQAIGTLKKRQDFLNARRGRRAHGRAFVVQAIDRTDTHNQIRFGYTVTRKTGNAVERNRIKRRLRAAIAQLAENLPLALAGNDVVVIARRAALDQPFSQLTAGLGRAIQQVVANDVPKGQNAARISPKKSQPGKGRA